MQARELHIRPEQPADASAVRKVNEAAFGSKLEAGIVEALHRESASLISLVAVLHEEIVGHIVFSPVSLAENTDTRLMGLGPMTVVPAHQRRGIGSELVREGLDQCRILGCCAVVVLGHAEYYPRFGFVPASRYGIESEYDVPDEIFMLHELEPGSLNTVSGQVSYSKAFSDA